LESERESTVAPSSIALRAAYWATLPEPEMATVFPEKVPWLAKAIMWFTYCHIVSIDTYTEKKRIEKREEREGEETYINKTITSSLRPNQRASPVSTLSSKNTLPSVPLSLVCAKQIPNLSTTNTNISSWNVGIGSNVLGQFAHEGDAEFADLVVGFAFGVEVCSAFAAADVHYTPINIYSPPLLTGEKQKESEEGKGRKEITCNSHPVNAFLKICSKPRNFKMLKLTVGWNLNPPL
jgi:hypothetical protein